MPASALGTPNSAGLVRCANTTAGMLLDPHAAQTYEYPGQLVRRDYQYQITRDALTTNSLVCLPTGLGKTLIAAVVMYNYYRWFPHGGGAVQVELRFPIAWKAPGFTTLEPIKCDLLVFKFCFSNSTCAATARQGCVPGAHAAFGGPAEGGVPRHLRHPHGGDVHAHGKHQGGGLYKLKSVAHT